MPAAPAHISARDHPQSQSCSEQNYGNQLGHLRSRDCPLRQEGGRQDQTNRVFKNALEDHRGDERPTNSPQQTPYGQQEIEPGQLIDRRSTVVEAPVTDISGQGKNDQRDRDRDDQNSRRRTRGDDDGRDKRQA